MNQIQKSSLSLCLAALINLALFMFSPNPATAQQPNESISVGMQIPSWIYKFEPTYSDMKNKFIQHYGSDKSNWPFFIQEAERLDNLFKEYNAAKGGNSEYCYYNLFFNDTDPGGHNPYPWKYKGSHGSYIRNFWSIFSFYYPPVESDGKIKPGNEHPWNYSVYKSKDITATYLDASKTEGILPAVLFQFAYDCPIGLLDWCFSEVFPVIDLLFKQDSISETYKIIKSVTEHKLKLIENKDYLKTMVWRYSIYNFLRYYEPPNSGEVQKYLSDCVWNSVKERTEIIELRNKDRKFDELFKNYFYNELKGFSYVVPCKVNTTEPKYYDITAKVNFVKDDGKSVGIFVNIDNSIDDKFLQHYNYQFTRSIDLFSSSVNNSTLKKNKFKSKSDVVDYYEGYGENDDGSVSQEWKFITGIKDECVNFFPNNTSVGLPKPLKTNEYSTIWTSEWGQVHVLFPSDINETIREKVINAYYAASEEFLGNNPIIPQIYGIDYKVPVIKKQAMKVVSNPKEIKADGQSTAEISVEFYDYILGDETSSKPLAGKVLSLEVQEAEGVKRGSVSTASAVTDANGEATFTFTAPTNELLQKLQPLNRFTSTVKVRSDEYGVEDLAYINFSTDKGKILVEPAMGVVSDIGIVPPDKRYPALITGYFEDENLKPVRNTEVTFSITGSNPLGMLRAPDGSEGKKLTVMSDSEGMAKVNYFYAADTSPDNPVTETIEAKTANMTIPLKASVAIGLNVVLEKVENGYEGKGPVNAGEAIPLKITVRDEWNQNLDLAQVMDYWGIAENSGTSKLYVKLEIEKQGFVPRYMLDYLGSQNFPEPIYEELLHPRSFKESKVTNLLYIPESSLKTYGYPRVKPMFSGTNNYEIRVSLTDENGKTIFESQHPRRTAFLSVPTDMPADVFGTWFASNPLGPHTETARFARMLLSTISIGEFGGFGSILSLADAAFAINSGNAEDLVKVMVSEIKGKTFGDIAEKKGVTAEIFKTYNDIATVEQYATFARTTYSDVGVVAQMENSVFSKIAETSLSAGKQMVILVGDGTQKLIKDTSGDVPESKDLNLIKDKLKISISGFDKKITEAMEKMGKVKKGKNEEIPISEKSFLHDESLDVTSLKNGNVSVYVLPAGMKVKSENATETISF